MADMTTDWMEDLEERDRFGSVLFLDPTTILYVSLFLILFAFFVALGVGGARHSVTGEVDSRLPVQTMQVTSQNGDLNLSDGRLGALSEEISKTFPDADVIIRQRRIEAELALEGFFVSGQVRLAPSKELFLKTLVDGMISAEDGSSTLSFVLGGGALEEARVQRQVALLAKTVQRYGLETERVRVRASASGAPGLVLVVEEGA